MMDFSDIKAVNAGLTAAQDYDEDIREAMREAMLFVSKRDGQWEPQVVERMRGQPRYTIDKVTPIINQIYGEISNSEYTIRVKATSGEDNAKIYDGLIREIRNRSNAESVFKSCAKDVLISGFAAWEIKQEWADADSFEQELYIKKIYNPIDRVWFDPDAKEQDNSDANYVYILSDVGIDEFKKLYPDIAQSSLSSNRTTEAYSYQNRDVVTVGKLLYKKPRDINLVLMSNGDVYQDNDDYQLIKDELEAVGIVEKDRRVRKGWRVYSRLFTAKDWLTDEEETVFDFLPVVALYGNYNVIENKRIMRGVVEKEMDSQRIYNYSISRAVRENALSPTEKLMMTHEQAAGNERQLRTMNVNNEPVLFYNHIADQPQPYKIGGAQLNQGLVALAQIASDDINSIAGLFSANLGSNPHLQSGVALDIQTQKGNNGMQEWVDSLVTAICYTGKVLVNAVPRTYDGERTIIIMGEDGSTEEQTINRQIPDLETGQIVTINNLAAGEYGVYCEVGQAFRSRQKEEKQAFVELASIIPDLAEVGKDVLLKNTGFDGMDLVAERMRALMLSQGVIPQEQMTREELALLQQQQTQPPQPDPNMIIAEAEMTKAQADMLAQQNRQAELQLQAAKMQAEMQGREQALNSKLATDAAKIDIDQQKLELQEREQQFNVLFKSQQMAINQQKAELDKLSALVEQLVKIKDATGADAIISPATAQAYNTQTALIQDAQQ